MTPKVTRGAEGAGEADAILLPGVGSFNQATRTLPMSRIRELVKSGKPTLGVCLGMQLFFSRSEEGGGRGFGLLDGQVKRLPDSVKVPQIGWNTITIRKSSELVEEVPDGSWVYYVHSYYPATEGSWVSATSEYGIEYPCIVAHKNVYGMQFHPEKSGVTGRRILRNFIRAVRR